MNGILYGIGVGPGDPELMTIKAMKAIENSSIIILPSKTKDDCYSYKIVKEVYPDIDKKNIVCFEFPMIKDTLKLKQAYDFIYNEVKLFLDEGHKIAFLTIGDPTVYSTYMYIHKRVMKDNFTCKIINGVPSFCAVAATLNISLGERSDEIHIIPGSYDTKEALSYPGTKIFMKSGKQIEKLVNELKIALEDNDFEVYGVSNCGMVNEKIYLSINEMNDIKGYLTMVIVKEK